MHEVASRFSSVSLKRGLGGEGKDGLDKAQPQRTDSESKAYRALDASRNAVTSKTPSTNNIDSETDTSTELNAESTPHRTSEHAGVTSQQLEDIRKLLDDMKTCERNSKEREKGVDDFRNYLFKVVNPGSRKHRRLHNLVRSTTTLLSAFTGEGKEKALEALEEHLIESVNNLIIEKEVYSTPCYVDPNYPLDHQLPTSFTVNSVPILLLEVELRMARFKEKYAHETPPEKLYNIRFELCSFVSAERLRRKSSR